MATKTKQSEMKRHLPEDIYLDDVLKKTAGYEEECGPVLAHLLAHFDEQDS